MKNLILAFAMSLTAGCTSATSQSEQSSNQDDLSSKTNTMANKPADKENTNEIEKRLESYSTFSFKSTEPINITPMSADLNGEISSTNGCTYFSKRKLLTTLPEKIYGPTETFLAVFYSDGRNNFERYMPEDETTVKTVNNLTVSILSGEITASQSDILFNYRALDCISKLSGSMDIALIGISGVE